ncbi:hypothetical protein CTRI78_v000514 [Colletotrichum trifolii]|uniref:Uncharacterized protein n=1 Tax=Colletotrichum trifolii TaxID=5466 RepID=A0A4R8RRL6_COLTR|nr:hypothetical protein CTRI78_v000514 [Colletotrichum trifolii]
MSEKAPAGRWNNPAFLQSLMMCFYDLLKSDGLNKEVKDGIEARLHREGFDDVTWNGISIRLAIIMADKGKWSNPVLLEALLMGFHGIAKDEGLSKEAKDAVVAKVHLWGFSDITWEGIRYNISFCCTFRVVSL